MTTKMYVTSATFDASKISIDLGEQKSSTVSNGAGSTTIKYHYVGVNYDYTVQGGLTKRGELAIRLPEAKLSKLEDCSKDVVVRSTGKKVRIEEYKGVLTFSPQDEEIRKLMDSIESTCKDLLVQNRALKKLPGIRSPLYGDADSDRDMRMYVNMNKAAIKMMRTKVDAAGKRTPVIVSNRLGEPGGFMWDPVSPLCFVDQRINGAALIILKHIYLDTSCTKVATVSMNLNSFAFNRAEPDVQEDLQMEEVTLEYSNNPAEVERLMNNMNEVKLSCTTSNTLSEKDNTVVTDGANDDSGKSDANDDYDNADDILNDDKPAVSMAARKVDPKLKVVK